MEGFNGGVLATLGGWRIELTCDRRIGMDSIPLPYLRFSAATRSSGSKGCSVWLNCWETIVSG